MTKIDKNWGYEEIIHNGDYCCKKLVYLKEIASSLHYHPKKHETFYVLLGKFDLELNATARSPGTHRIMKEGDHVVIPPGHTHRLRCLERGVILESSTHDDPEDCVRLIPSEA